MIKLTAKDVAREIVESEAKLREYDERAFRTWKRIRISPELWSQQQYPDIGPVWVVGVMGRRCLYFNGVEGGWGWGQDRKWGQVIDYHCQLDEIYQVVNQTVWATDNGGTGLS